MLFAHGWPRAYSAFPRPQDRSNEIIAVRCGGSYIMVASQTGIQIWSASQHPVRLGQRLLNGHEIGEAGVQVAAEWSEALGSAVALTSGGWLLFYAVNPSGQAVFPPGSALGVSARVEFVDVLVAVRIRLFEDAEGLALSTDGSVLLVGLSTGGLQGYLWKEVKRSLPIGTRWRWGKDTPHWFLGALDELAPEGDELGAGEAERGEGEEQDVGRGVPARGAAPDAIVDMHYSPEEQLLALTTASGTVALWHAPQFGLQPFVDFGCSAWISGESQSYVERAVCARVGPAAGMVAVGCHNGSVSLYPLGAANRVPGGNPGNSSLEPPSPVRRLTLLDWGHGPEVTGPVADIQWTPDSTAFAVGYAYHGIAVWTPSGCRLMCSLPQASLSRAVTGPGKSHTRLGSLDGFTGLSAGVDGSIRSSVEDVPALEWGVGAVGWGRDGYKLWMGQRRNAQFLWELRFVRALIGSHRVAHLEPALGQWASNKLDEVYILQGDDRILLITEGAGELTQPHSLSGTFDLKVDATNQQPTNDCGGLTVRHILVPQHYIAENWPVRQAAVSPDSGDVAVAGRHGLALFSRKSEKWRLFGDVGQERAISALVVNWLGRIVVVCSEPQAVHSRPNAGTPACELLLFPQYHLDFGSLLAAPYGLDCKPIAVECTKAYILVASQPLEILILGVSLDGELGPSSPAKATLSAVRKLSIVNVERPVVDVALVVPPLPREESGVAPRQCVVLRWGGLMSMLDLEEGLESPLTSEVECFWLSDAARMESNKFASSSGQDDAVSLRSSVASVQRPMCGERDGAGSPTPALDVVEMPWWAYGARGMELWFPSSLAEPLSPKRVGGQADAFNGALDPELEFDREVYPVGISLADAAVVGVTQRTLRSPTQSKNNSNPGHLANLPCFFPMPDSQPVLPCLLRRLLQKGSFHEAKTLACRHQRLGLHFSRSLEWLLFTALEFDSNDVSTVPWSAKTVGGGQQDVQMPLLSSAARLVRSFPQYPDVVVSVARKTDAQLWPALFLAVGPPSVLLSTLLEQGGLHSAACLLIVVDELEGPAMAQKLALRVLQASLTSGQYDLVSELLRYLLGPGELEQLFTYDAVKLQERTAPPAKQEEPMNGSMSSWLYSWWWDPSKPEQDGKNGESVLKDEPPVQHLSDGTAEAAAMVREHVWRLLDFGRLRLLATLGRALASLGGGLPALMASARDRGLHLEDGDWGADQLLLALATAVTELASADEGSNHFDAELLLEMCQLAHCTAWSVALALILQHMPVLVGFRMKHPEVWAEIHEQVCNDAKFADFVAVVEAVQGGSGGSEDEGDSEAVAGR